MQGISPDGLQSVGAGTKRLDVLLPPWSVGADPYRPPPPAR